MPQELSAADKSLVVSDPTGSLEFYNTAIVAINKAATVDEVREIRDKAAALQAYAKQVENRVFEKQAAIIRMRAEVKGGQLFEALAIKAGVRRGSSVIGLGARAAQLTTIAKLAAQYGLSEPIANKWLAMARGAEKYSREEMEKKYEQAAEQGGSQALIRELTKPAIMAKKAARKQRLKLPKGKFDAIVLDPEWDADNLLALSDEIRMITDACLSKVGHVFLWVPNLLIPAGLRIIEDCSLEYQQFFVWHKTDTRDGACLMDNAEFAIYARRGSVELTRKVHVSTCFAAEDAAGKPDAFYAMISSATKGKSRLDAYAKRKVAGFASWAKV